MVSVLVLDAGYRPVGEVGLRRAVTLLLNGAAEREGGVAARLRTPNQVYEVPAVLRLRRRHYINVPQRGATWSLHGVLKRDHWTCIYCGAQPGTVQEGVKLTRADFSVDHLQPRSRGGLNTWTNTACACRRCNQRKGNRTVEEMGWKLRWLPKLPRVDYQVIYLEGRAVSWKVFLRV